MHGLALHEAQSGVHAQINRLSQWSQPDGIESAERQLAQSRARRVTAPPIA